MEGLKSAWPGLACSIYRLPSHFDLFIWGLYFDFRVISRLLAELELFYSPVTLTYSFWVWIAIPLLVSHTYWLELAWLDWFDLAQSIYWLEIFIQSPLFFQRSPMPFHLMVVYIFIISFQVSRLNLCPNRVSWLACCFQMLSWQIQHIWIHRGSQSDSSSFIEKFSISLITYPHFIDLDLFYLPTESLAFIFTFLKNIVLSLFPT